MIKKKCFVVNSINQLNKLISLNKIKRKTLIIFIKNNLITGFGIDWLNTYIKIIKKKYKDYNFKFVVDSGKDYGLSQLLMKEDIDFLMLKSNKIILNKINQIAKKNKVLLNPNFDVVDISKIMDNKN